MINTTNLPERLSLLGEIRLCKLFFDMERKISL